MCGRMRCNRCAAVVVTLQAFKQSDYMVSEEARTPNVHSRQVNLQIETVFGHAAAE
jgi:hypothetical protein